MTMKIIRFITAIGCLLFCLPLLPTAAQDGEETIVLRVDPDNADVDVNHLCPLDLEDRIFPDIRSAVFCAEDGMLITIAAGIYYENVTIDKSVRLTGEGRELTIIDGGGEKSVFNVGRDLTVGFVGMTIRNGNGDMSNGGAITTYSGDIEARDVTLIENVSQGAGGAIYTYEGDITLEDVAIRSNTAGRDGGGVYSYKGDVTITDAEISGNTSQATGGGIYTYEGDIDLKDAVIDGNTTEMSGGGGIYTYKGSITADSIQVTGNTARDGGGIYAYSGSISLTDVTIEDNTASFSGGGIYNYSGDIDTSGKIAVVSNTADYSGGGIYSYLGTLHLVEGMIVAGNYASDAGGGIYAYSGVIENDGAIISDNAAGRDGADVFQPQ